MPVAVLGVSQLGGLGGLKEGVAWRDPPGSACSVYIPPVIWTLSFEAPSSLPYYILLQLCCPRGGTGGRYPPLLSIMCQTTAPLTKKPSHLLWNAFSQRLPSGLDSVEVSGRRLITFGPAIFSSSFQ